MSNKKSSRENYKQEDILQAVVIADNFSKRFEPVSQHKPTSLLSLANTPLIDYTLQFLGAAGIQHTIVFCSSHAQKIRDYLGQSVWTKEDSPMEVEVISSDSCLSMGDALRDIDAKSLIQNDFVLVNGPVISNIKLKSLIDEHKQRRLKDKTPIMTQVLKKSPPGHRTRSAENELVIAVRRDNSQILYFQRVVNTNKISLPVDILENHADTQLRFDLIDTNISLCSPHVPPLFTDEFDYLTQDHFVRGILVNQEIMGHTIHVRVIEDEYAAHVSSLKMYDSISRDVLGRWSHPLVPDFNFSGCQRNKYSYGRHNIYLHGDVTLARGCVLEENVIIGGGTSVGRETLITHSVIGNNCVIGEDVRIEGAYILDNVVIGDKCVITTALLDDDVQLNSDVKIHPGCVLAKGVVIGPGVTLPPAKRLMSKPLADDFGDVNDTLSESAGIGGVAYDFEVVLGSDEEDEDDVILESWGQQLEPGDESDDELENLMDDLELGGEEPTEEEELDESKMFYNEVIGTLERATSENIALENLILEINSLKHAYGIVIQEVNVLLTKAILALPMADGKTIQPQGYIATVKASLEKHFLPLLANYMRSAESQKDCLTGIEELCLSSEVVRKSLTKLLYLLYEEDVLSEQVILHWHSHPQTGDDLDQRNKLRKELETFITWLQEAEEESEESD